MPSATLMKFDLTGARKEGSNRLRVVYTEGKMLPPSRPDNQSTLSGNLMSDSKHSVSGGPMPLRASYAAYLTFLMRRLTHSALVLTVFVLPFSLSALSAGAAAAPREHVIYSFSNSCFNPIAPLIADRDGNLYGTAFNGGPNMAGCVFVLSLRPARGLAGKALPTLY